MDIIKIIGESRLYNFHSHTQFCDGRATMEEFAQAAVDAQFTHYGFSPHSPIPFDSPCNMTHKSVSEYIAEVNRLKSLWGDRINLYASMEIDYIGDEWGPANSYFDSIPLDYRIGSVHFIPSDYGYIDVDGSYENFKAKMSKYFHNDIKHVVKTFYRQSTKMLEAGRFDIIGHFDKIGHNAGHFKADIEKETWYKRLVMDLMDLIIDKRVIVEINTKAWEGHHRMFPGIAWIPYLMSHNVPIIINSDAHYPHLINASRQVAFDLLRGN